MNADTDETYGYFEPLHFLLYGHGMQTWEYSPEFAIRTYAFVLPFVPLCRLLMALGCEKITVFFSIKMVLGQAFAWAAARFLQAMQRLVPPNPPGPAHALLPAPAPLSLSLLLLLGAPGVFFCSSAFLPSAACSSLVMAAVASWADCDHPRRELSGYLSAVFFGCMAVVASGW
jgi:alpha-1,2-mannosyltransferase